MKNSIVSKQEFEKFPTLAFLRLEQVLKLIPVSKATWWNGCKDGQFPKPYKIGPRVTAWKVKDILKMIEGFQQSD